MDFQEINKISCVKTSSRGICGTCFTICIRLTQTHPDAASASPFVFSWWQMLLGPLQWTWRLVLLMKTILTGCFYSAIQEISSMQVLYRKNSTKGCRSPESAKMWFLKNHKQFPSSHLYSRSLSKCSHQAAQTSRVSALKDRHIEIRSMKSLKRVQHVLLSPRSH